jgi:hypothetical protein
MERLTTKERLQELKDKGNLSEEEKIYYTLGLLENDFESKTIFTKKQFQIAIAQAIKVLTTLIRERMTKEIALAVIEEIKGKAVDGKIDVAELEKLETEIKPKNAEEKAAS